MNVNDDYVRVRKECSNCDHYTEYLKYGDDIFDYRCSLSKAPKLGKGYCDKWEMT